MESKAPKKSTGPVDHNAAPGEITGPAQDTLRGDPGAVERFYALVAPQLRELARRHLQSQGDLELSSQEVANMTILAFARSADFDLRSRKQFFEFADRQAAIIVELAAQGTIDQVDPLLGIFKGTRKATALGQAIREISEIDGDLAHILRSRYVLDLKQSDVADLLDQPGVAARKSWQRAEGLLSAKYKQIEADAESTAGSLDTKSSQGYSERDSLSPAPLSADLESTPSAPHEEIEELRQENGRLRTELQAAQDQIVGLEAQIAAASSVGTSEETRAEIDALLTPRSLEGVPLFAGSTSAELFDHLDAQYGRWLVHFGAEHDSISLDQIREHDPEFVKKLSQRISRLRKRERAVSGEPQTPTLGEMMPTEAERGDLALAGLSVEDLFDPAHRKPAALVYGRLGRHLYGTGE